MQARKTLVRALGLVAVGVLSTAGMPDNGMPDNGMPDNGMPDNGMPDNGMPDNGNSPEALINTPLFFNRATHAYWVTHPFTAGSITAPGSPLRATISDPFSALVMSYQWQLCHPQGDDATVTDANGRSHTFLGRIGLCVLSGGHGWHSDSGLDLATARVLSASTITQVNRLQVHNRYSLRGSLSQLTGMSASLTSYRYKFGTDQPVESLQACPAAPPSTGQAACGWKPHFVGLGRPGSTVHIAADSGGLPMLLQVNLGIHGQNPGEPGAIATSGPAGAINPSVDFTVPVGGTWNVQWALDPRPISTSLPATIAPPTLAATLTSGGGTLRFPADEVFVFPNREMYATAMLYDLTSADDNIPPIPGRTDSGAPVADCEPRPNSDGFTEFCDASDQQGCIFCFRTTTEGARSVVFPNAHLWLSSGWTNAQDYYALRSCTSDLASCVAHFEGFIDARFCGLADPHCLLPGATTVARACDVQSADRDSTTPLPYFGQPQPLQDATRCHIGSGPDTGFGVTTLFANYGSIGACWATDPTDPTCAFTPPKVCKDPDRDEEHHGDRDRDRSCDADGDRDHDRDRR